MLYPIELRARSLRREIPQDAGIAFRSVFRDAVFPYPITDLPKFCSPALLRADRRCVLIGVLRWLATTREFVYTVRSL